MTGTAESATTASVIATARPDLQFDVLGVDPDNGLLALVHAKGGLYERSFPQKKRDDLETHRRALQTSPNLHFVVATAPGSPRHVVGFATVRYYAGTRCGLLSDFVFDEGSQQPEVAAGLVTTGIDALRADGRLRAVFAEIVDPARADATAGSTAPLDVARSMHALDARRVPIPYVRPSRYPHSPALMLVAIPIAGRPIESVERELVLDFVKELFGTLQVPQRTKDVDLARSLVGLRDDDEPFELWELVSQETPTFVEADDKEKHDRRAKAGPVERYGVAIHLVLEPNQGPASRRWWQPWVRQDDPALVVSSGDARSDAEAARHEANPLRSFEEDILAYADPYRATSGMPAAPFSTSTVEVPEDCARISVSFPAELTFRSEGRLVPLRCDGLDPNGHTGIEEWRTRRFLLRVSKTYFTRSKLTVLHLVLGPDPGDPTNSTLNEYDLIKLMKLWQPGEGLTRDGIDATPGQEHAFVSLHTVAGEGPIDEAPTAGKALEELAKRVFDGKPPGLVDINGPRAGTVQVLHRCCEKGARNALRLNRGMNICGEIDEVLKYEGAIKPSKRLEALGGLVCGLLDFAEIDGDELADVFREVTHDDQLVRSFHKGTLLLASPSDRAFETEGIRASVGVSPYLLIPHAVLLHNEWWLAEAVRRLDTTVRGSGQVRRRADLEQVRAGVAQTLSQFLVPNVFNYIDERSLYETGLKARGLHKREEAVRERLDELTSKLNARHERLRSFVGTALALILLVFTLSDVYDKHSRVYFALSTVVTVALLAVLFWLWIRSDDAATERYAASR